MKKKIEAAPQDQIDEEFADEFISKICGFNSVFVSDESRLRDFIGSYFFKDEPGRNMLRDAVIKKVKKVYGADISSVFHSPLPELLKHVKDTRTR